MTRIRHKGMSANKRIAPTSHRYTNQHFHVDIEPRIWCPYVRESIFNCRVLAVLQIVRFVKQEYFIRWNHSHYATNVYITYIHIYTYIVLLVQHCETLSKNFKQPRCISWHSLLRFSVCHFVQFNVNLWVLRVFSEQLASTEFGSTALLFEGNYLSIFLV